MRRGDDSETPPSSRVVAETPTSNAPPKNHSDAEEAGTEAKA